MLKLYNTLTKKAAEFKPVHKEVVNMYSCGPTVYYYAHIGNMRAYLFMDFLRRTLKYNGYKLNGVLNLTDVGHLTSDADEGEDKMAVASKRENKSPWEIADYYTKFYFTQTTKLNIDMPEHVVKATDVIKEMIEMVETLMANGFAYETSKGIYYDVEKYSAYGALSGMHVDDKLAGARIEVDTEKHNPADFALWVKAPKEHIMQWPSPWGMGYPGWHIECSAIGISNLGTDIDIHTGGIDHVTVHHENEIAQNYGYTKKDVVHNWMHVEFLQVDGGKMSKSLGNIYTIDELEEKGYRALDFKYFCLNTHYRKKINFTFDALSASRTALTRLYEQTLLHKNGSDHVAESVLQKYKAEFLKAINSDLNAPLALSVVWNLVKNENKSPDVYQLLIDFDKVLGLNLHMAQEDEKIIKMLHSMEEVIPGDVVLLAERRWLAKQEKNWALADELRQRIAEFGYQVLDKKETYEIKKL